MQKNISAPFLYFFSVIVIVGLACSLPGVAQQSQPPEPPAQDEPPPPPPEPTATLFAGESNLPGVPTATSTPEITHVDFPSGSVDLGGLVYDVESSGTAPEKRAPYGDSYKIYRMERPFDQNMDYIPDMDIATYSVKITEDWIYVSIELIGADPNNAININYGVEIDTDGDGFGEYIIWVNPPYSSEWSTDGVQVFADQNRDTGGLSAEKSDAPFNGDGYETMLFDSGIGDDPDLAWVRINAGRQATIQFAFKESLAGSSFLLGVLSDAGLRDVGKMFYNDLFTEAEAGSPEKSEQYYPLKELHSFDNTCREAFNFSTTGFEPLLCPRDQPEPGKAGGCENPSQYTDSGSCTAAGCAWVQNPNVLLVAIEDYCTSP